MTTRHRDFVPQVGPKAGYLSYKAEIETAIHKVLESGCYILGPEVMNFEQEFSSYVGVANCIGVASGTDALEIALRACDIGQGELVFTVSYTAVATVAAIVRCGATPVLVDIDPDTFTMDSEQLEEAIIYQKKNNPSCRPKAIIPVHLYGHPADMNAVMDIAERNHLLVIEDCAQAHGAKLDGRNAGTWGDLGAFSFYPTKNLGALGDGGAVVTKDAQLAKKVRALREYGWQERYVSAFSGINSRIDELQAGILRVKLRHLDEDNAHRRNLAGLYLKRLASTNLTLPVTRQGIEHAYHQFVIRSMQRDALHAHLKARGIDTAIHYPLPVHLQPAYKKKIVAIHAGLPESERAAREVLSLPLYPELSDEAVNTVMDEILNFKQAGKK